MNKKMTFA